MASKLFWVLLTIVFAFLFIVLFENGTTDYVNNCVAEYHQMVEYFTAKPHKPGEAGDKTL